MRQWLLRLWLAALVAMTLLASAAPAQNAVSADEARKVRVLAASLSAVPDRADRVLAAVQFHPDFIATSEFSQWPALRKFETGYLSAVAGGGPDEGRRFLAAVTHAIANDHTAAVRHDALLKSYFENPPPSGAIRYAAIPALPEAPTDQAVRRAILALERYAERVPGGLQGTLARCCGLSPDAIYDVLRSAPDRATAIIWAIDRGTLPPATKERLKEFFRNVLDNTRAPADQRELMEIMRSIGPIDGEATGFGLPAEPSATLEQTVAGIEDEVRPRRERILKAVAPDAAGASLLSTSLQKSMVPPSNFGALANDAAYRAAYQASGGEFPGFSLPGGSSPGGGPGSARPSPGRVPFTRMSTSRRGFGGVVFGAPVTSSAGLKAQELFWVEEAPAPGNGWGRYDVVLTNGSVVSTRRLRTDDSFAGWEIVTGREGAFPALDVAGGEGVGLASVNPDSPVMLVHPALYGLELGDSAVMVDAIGFKMSPLALDAKLEQVGASAETRDKASRWQTGPRGYYKFIDVPLDIVVRDGVLRTKRADGAGHGERFREVGFLSFQAMAGSVPQEESYTPFYELLPAMMSAFPQFERLNGFAETLAILRWAKASGARIASPRQPTRGDARLFVFEHSDGSLGQSARAPTALELAALTLAQRTGRIERLRERLQKVGSPATEIDALTDLLQQQHDAAVLASFRGTLPRNSASPEAAAINHRIDEDLGEFGNAPDRLEWATRLAPSADGVALKERLAAVIAAQIDYEAKLTAFLEKVGDDAAEKAAVDAAEDVLDEQQLRVETEVNRRLPWFVPLWREIVFFF